MRRASRTTATGRFSSAPCSRRIKRHVRWASSLIWTLWMDFAFESGYVPGIFFCLWADQKHIELAIGINGRRSRPNGRGTSLWNKGRDYVNLDNWGTYRHITARCLGLTALMSRRSSTDPLFYSSNRSGPANSIMGSMASLAIATLGRVANILGSTTASSKFGPLLL